MYKAETLDDALFGPKMLADPYPYYRQLRSDYPVYWSEKWEVWILTRHDDVVFAMRDARLSYHEKMKSFFEHLPTSVEAELAVVDQHVSTWLGHKDPPDHTRLRALVTKAFAPRFVKTMYPHIEQLVNGLIDVMIEQEQFDLIWDFAYPLPASVIAEMLGVPPEDHHQFKQWTEDIVAFLGSARAQPDTLQPSQKSVEALRAYVLEAVRHRKKNPSNDLLTNLINAEEAGGKLTEDEIVGISSGLFIAGHETTTNLIGNGMLALLKKPAQLKLLREQPTLIKSALEEVLRYDSPVQRSWGVATEDYEIHGHRIRKGQIVLKMLGAANRDPEQFANPEELDITRKENHHIAFGYGVHFCLGAPLARLEGEIAITALLQRLPHMQLAVETEEWYPNMAFRGLKTLPVHFRP